MLCVSGQHEDINIIACSDSDEENMYGLDGEELAYADFNKKEEIYPQPPFVDPLTFGEGAYENALVAQQNCKQNLQVCNTAMKGFPLEHGKYKHLLIVSPYLCLPVHTVGNKEPFDELINITYECRYKNIRAHRSIISIQTTITQKPLNCFKHLNMEQFNLKCIQNCVFTEFVHVTYLISISFEFYIRCPSLNCQSLLFLIIS